MMLRPVSGRTFVGKIAHENVRAAAGRERADDVDVLRRIVVGARQRRRDDQTSEQ